MELGNLWLIPFSVLFNSGLYWLQKHYLVKWYCRRFLSDSVELECDQNSKQSQSHSNGTTVANGAVHANGIDSRESSESYGKRKLVTDGEIASVSMENVGSVIAGITAIVSGIVMIETRHDIINDRSSILIPWCHIAGWYFVVDLYNMYDSFYLRKKISAEPFKKRLYMFVRAKLPFVLHHVLLFTFGYTIVVNDHLRGYKGDFLVASIIGEDLSNPLVNSAKVFRLLGQDRTRLYVINGYLLVFTFFVVRILNIPFDLIVYAAQYHNWNIFQALLKLHLVCYVSIILMYILQFYWFIMILKLALKGLRDMREEEAKRQLEHTVKKD